MTNVGHYNDPRSTVKRWTFDNAQRYVTTFRPISEAARSWSCDNVLFTDWLYCVNLFSCIAAGLFVFGHENWHVRSQRPSGAYSAPKVLLSVEGSERPYMVTLVQASLDRFSRFCSADGRDHHTDGQLAADHRDRLAWEQPTSSTARDDV